MAYQLKSTGIAANCTMLIAVDPDTGTVKDFASSAVTADMTVGANVTTGSQAWDGNTRHYFRHGAGTTDADFVKFGTTKPNWTFNVNGLERTWVFVGEVAGTQARAFGKDSSIYTAQINLAAGGSTHPAHVGAGYATSASGGNASPASGSKRIFGFSMKHGSAGGHGYAYTAADTDASMTVTDVGAPTSTSATNNFDLTYVGRRNDATAHQQDKVHLIAIFDASLAEADWDTLRDDWFGTLLETAGGGGGGGQPPRSMHLSRLMRV